ncbi:hypothetical protein D3C87_1647570 [compost metagenome]
MVDLAGKTPVKAQRLFVTRTDFMRARFAAVLMNAGINHVGAHDGAVVVIPGRNGRMQPATELQGLTVSVC